MKMLSSSIYSTHDASGKFSNPSHYDNLPQRKKLPPKEYIDLIIKCDGIDFVKPQNLEIIGDLVFEKKDVDNVNNALLKSCSVYNLRQILEGRPSEEEILKIVARIFSEKEVKLLKLNLEWLSSGLSVNYYRNFESSSFLCQNPLDKTKTCSYIDARYSPVCLDYLRTCAYIMVSPDSDTLLKGFFNTLWEPLESITLDRQYASYVISHLRQQETKEGKIKILEELQQNDPHLFKYATYTSALMLEISDSITSSVNKGIKCILSDWVKKNAIYKETIAPMGAWMSADQYEQYYRCHPELLALRYPITPHDQEFINQYGLERDKSKPVIGKYTKMIAERDEVREHSCQCALI